MSVWPRQRPTLWWVQEVSTMTLFYFRNGFALGYFPYFITYKCSGLSTMPSGNVCRPGSPTSSCSCARCCFWPLFFFLTWEGGMYEFTGEFMKASVDVVDLIGLNLVMSQNAGKGEDRSWVLPGAGPPPCSLCPATSPSEWEPRALNLTGSTSRRAWTPTLVWSITSMHPPGSR